MKKKVLSLVLALVLCISMVPGTVLADDGESGEESYFSMSLTGYSGYYGPGGDVVIPAGGAALGNGLFQGREDITSVVVPEGVTLIGSYAFQGCTSLTSVTLPESLRTIQSSAFKDCSSLTNIVLPASVTQIGDSTFENCTSLTDFSILDNITQVGASAFKGCTGFTGTLEIPSSVTKIADSAFAGCNGITKVVLPNNGIVCGGFTGCTGITEVVIPADAKISQAAFQGCPNLSTIQIDPGNSLLDASKYNGSGYSPCWVGPFCIADGAIRQYDGTASTVVIPEGITRVAGFKNHTELEEIVLPDSLIEINREAFYGCTGLTSVTIPDGVTNIADKAFASCSNLTQLDMGSSSATVDATSFVGCPLNNVSSGDEMTQAQMLGMNIENGVLVSYTGSATEVAVPVGVTSIGKNAFVGKSNVTKITLPEGLTKIEDSAFSLCTGLKEIILPSTLKTVGSYAFQKCASLTELSFPSGVTSVSTMAFQGCTALARVTASESSGIGWAHFSGCTAMTLSGMPTYLQGEGVFERSDTTLVKYHGEGGDVVVPSGITEIAYEAFYPDSSTPNLTSIPSITSITFPDSVWYIADRTFAKCTGLRAIVFPSGFGLEDISNSLMSGVNDSTIITVAGVSQSWGELKALRQEEEEKRQEEERKQQQESSLQNLWDSAYDNNKYSSAYLDRLEANREFIASNFNGIGDLAYKYTAVTDDVRKLSNQLCAGLSTDREKVTALHQWVIENIYYDFYDYSQYSAQQALENKNCVCSGYSRLMQALCWAQGIPAVIALGAANGFHAWNVVQVDGQWLWLDATWDTFNAYRGGDSWIKGSTRLNYFLCPDEFISTDHKATSVSLQVSMNVDPAVYYAVVFPALNPNCSSLGDMTGTLHEGLVDEIIAIRAREGLDPVTFKRAGSTFYIYYYDPSARSDTDADTETTVEQVIDPDEEWKKLEEELEKEYLEEQKKQALEDPTLSAWAVEEVVKALELKLVPQDIQSNYSANITRLDFCRLMVALVRAKGRTIPAADASPFVDVDSVEVTAAYVLGIVKGVGDDRFDPTGFITRQEAATMLSRTADVLELGRGEGESFVDEDSFADWARDGIHRVSGLADPTSGKMVMQGFGAGVFSPLTTYSREQAILTAYRLFNVEK